MIRKNGPRWKKILRIASVLGAVGGVAAVVSMIFFQPPSFLRIQEVAVMTPLNRLSEFDLIRLSEVKKGDNIVRLRLSKVRENLRRFPWIKEIRLSKRIPARLLIWVEEQDPIALLEIPDPSGANGWYLVNREGKAFKKAESGDPKDLPILTGIAPEEIPVRLPTLITLLKSIEESDLLASLGVSEIRWTGAAGVSLFTKDPCIRLDLGRSKRESDDSASLWEEELMRFSEAWGTIRATAKRPKVVDLSLERRIIVKQGF